jgi:hypothetical protein
MSEIETMFMSKFYSYLIETACSTPDSYLTIPDISKRINILPHRGKPLASLANKALDKIACHEHSKGSPLLTAIVVKQDQGIIIPGQGFFRCVISLGLLDRSSTDAERMEFWKKEFNAVHSYWKIT